MKEPASLLIKASHIDPNLPLPFEDFYLEFVRTARSQLHNLLSASQLEILTEKAQIEIERNLLEQLVNLGTETLLLEFDRLRPDSIASDEIPNRISYHAFINSLLDGKIALLQDYPVLEKLITNTIDLWVESTVEFIQRLHADRSELEQTFANGIKLGQIVAIDPSLADRHQGGRLALALTFSSGIKVVYKPINLSMNVAFYQLLSWCNQENISVPYKLLKILPRSGYGWQEFINQEPCTDRSMVQHFYHRSGGLLAILFILGAKDYDCKNAIAHGEHPIPIDVDSLLNPGIDGAALTEDKWFEDSVLHVGILPRWNGDMYTANPLDSSVLGNIFPKQTNSSKEWKFINTDGMHLVPKITVIPAGRNGVVLEGKTISSQAYVEEIVSGFEEIYQLFIDRQAFLLSPESPFSTFQHLQSRFYLRSSIAYRIIHQQSLKPDRLRDSAEYCSSIESLLRNYAPSNISIGDRSALDQIVSAETRSLQQLNIPYFSTSGDTTALSVDKDTAISNFFTRSGYQRLQEKLQHLNADNLAKQIWVIRSSFAAKFAHLAKNNAVLQAEFPSSDTLSPADLQQEAFNIGNNLVTHAIWDGDGCNWLKLEYMFRAHRYQLDLLDDSLYTGRAGISIFLAALAKISGDPQFSKVALGALEPFRRSIRAGKTRPELSNSEFGLLGLGGMIYSMVKVSQFLQEPTLLEDAQQAAKLLTPEAIASDQKLDVIWGVTGAILGLLSLYRATQDKALLDIATNCGHHLLAQRTDTHPRAWVTNPSESTKPLTGFSHGAAGIALALLKLHAATGDRDFLAAAQAGMDYERSVFNKTAQNWPDFRMAEQRGELNYLDTWCHGSTGIGLARLGSFAIFPNSEIRQEIEIALNTSQKNGMFNRGIDHLCCGNIGKIELLVLANQLCGDSLPERLSQQLLETARESASKMVFDSKDNGFYRLQAHPVNSSYSPSFYRGSAGVGYELLRVTNPGLVPSVAIWE
jgi:type 2 lantibiotic biosynthesis protein LanM